MSRRTVPILLGSILLLFLSLVVIIAFYLNDFDRKSARLARSAAQSQLVGRDGELVGVASDILWVQSPQGSLTALIHFLGKDPGRREFSSASDRRFMERYASGDVGIRASQIAQSLEDQGQSSWVPDYVGLTRALFENVAADLLAMTGVPSSFVPELVELIGHSNQGSSLNRLTGAIGTFGTTWIPQGETVLTYRPDREQVRAKLIGDRRFRKKMEEIDGAWRELTASLYGLANHPGWALARSYDPSLAVELDQLITVVLAADLYRRTVDLMLGVDTGTDLFDQSPSTGLLWVPDMTYYKNVPEVNGRTADDITTFFFSKVNIGYSIGDRQTQTWLNRRKDILTAKFAALFSSVRGDDFIAAEQETASWFLSMLKAQVMHDLNLSMSASFPFGRRKAYGVRDLAFIRVNLLTDP